MFILGLDILRKNLIEHLNDMNYWKDYLEQDREFEKVPERNEKEIVERSFEEQVDYLNSALTDENRRLQVLLKQHEIEEQQVLSHSHSHSLSFTHNTHLCS
jgi:hypothetical protein